MDTRTSLLENMLDALDRLFDRETSTVDVCALTYATLHALGTDSLAPVFKTASVSLRHLLREKLPSSNETERALDITNELRLALAEAIP